MITTLLLIFTLQVIYVSLLTIRTILTVKGYRYWAALLSALDILTYVIGFKIVLDNLDNPINLVVYCLSYGVGILVGIKIEEKLALGFVNVQVITDIVDRHMVNELRKKGYGVTVTVGEGLEGARLILSIVSTRKQQNQLISIIKSLNPNCFVYSYEPRLLAGGYIIDKLKKFK
jgi:uncharacterized protein YebE (UPF0316 family)